MSTEIKRQAETILVTDTSKIALGEIVEKDGRFVRALRIWGSGGQDSLPVLEILADAEEADALKITTPELTI